MLPLRPDVRRLQGSARGKVHPHRLGILLYGIALLLILGCAQTPALGPEEGIAGEDGEKKTGKVVKAPKRGDRPVPIPEGVIPPEVTGDEKEKGEDGKEEGKDGGTSLIGGSLAAEFVKLQSQVAGLQAQLGELQNYKNSVDGRLGGIQTSVEGLKEQAEEEGKRLESVEGLLAGNQKLLGKLERLQEGAKKEQEKLWGRQKDVADEMIDVQDKLDKLAESDENLGEDVRGLRDAKAGARHPHEDYLSKVDFTRWKGESEQYVPGQHRLWYLAVCFLIALIIGGVVFWLNLKAIRPAYNSLNEIRAKLTTLVNRQGEDVGGV